MSELSDKLMDIATQASEWDDIRERSEELFPDEFNTAINPRGDQIGRTVCNLLQELADRRIQSQRKMCEQLPESLGTYNRSETKDVQEKLHITKIGSKDAEGRYTGWEFSGEGLKNPAPGLDVFTGEIGGYTSADLDKIMTEQSGADSTSDAKDVPCGSIAKDRFTESYIAGGDRDPWTVSEMDGRNIGIDESSYAAQAYGGSSEPEVHVIDHFRKRAAVRAFLFNDLRLEVERLHLTGPNLSDQEAFIAIRDILNAHRVLHHDIRSGIPGV